MNAKRVLSVFAKQPIVGQVKTRLAAETSPEWAATAAEAFLLDTLDRLAAVPARRMLAYAPPEAESYFARISQGRYDLVPQVAGDLGGRMKAFLSRQVSMGAHAVIVGTDSPTLPITLLEQAWQELEHADVVLGPATDGGYYLLGCKGKAPPIFEGIAWGSASVLAETIASLSAASFRWKLLDPWYDVDTKADWDMLCTHLAQGGIHPDLPRTRRLAGLTA